MYLLLSGITLLAVIIGLFWLKDRQQSHWLARFAYSGLVARLAVLGATFSILGLLLILSDYIENF